MRASRTASSSSSPGPSGSGKSTLAFDVVFAEGQRRFLETLTPYARQFLPTLPRPDVDRVTGVPPSIALEQRTTRAGANSTVATVTEVAHYLRLLYAKVGELHCPNCDAPIAALARDAICSPSSRTVKRRSARFSRPPSARARAPTSISSPPRRAPASRTRAPTASWSSTDAPPRLAQDQGAHHRSRSSPRLARDARPRRARSRARAGARRGEARSRTRRATRTTSGSSRRAQLSASAARACPSSIRAGSRSTPSKVSARRAKAPAWTAVAEAASGGRDRATCAACQGSRLSPVPRAVRLGGARYHEIGGALGASARSRRCKTLEVHRRSRAHRQGAAAPSSCAASRVLERGRASATSRSTARRARSPAARCSACASPRSSERAHRRALRARRADHRPPPARHRAPPRATCARSSTPARRCSSSSTTPRRSAPPTT